METEDDGKVSSSANESDDCDRKDRWLHADTVEALRTRTSFWEKKKGNIKENQKKPQAKLT